MKKLVLIGAGGHCRSVLDSIAQGPQIYDEVVLCDQNVPLHSFIDGYEVVGRDDDLRGLYEAGYEYAFITLGSVETTKVRRKLVKLAEEVGFQFVTVIDPSAMIAKSAVIGEGTFVGKGAVVNAGATIGRHCIVNTLADVDHDCKVGEFTHISLHSILCGNVTVGSDNFIGAGATLKQGLVMGNGNIIGMNSTVLHDVGDDGRHYGVI